MLILLPPSETKLPGGEGERLAVSGLRFTQLARPRRELIRAVREQAVGSARARRAAGRSAPKPSVAQREQVEYNRWLGVAPTMAAVDRYSGVLYSALDAQSLTEEQRAFLGQHVAIQSSLFGPVGALDAIPAYRLSFDSRVPSLGRSLRAFWTDATVRTAAQLEGPVLDLRSDGYAALMPLPREENAAYVTVTARGQDGVARALNHFNKQAKGALVREIVGSGIVHPSLESLLDWARSSEIELVRRDDGLELVVPRIVGEPGDLSASLR